MILGQNVQCLRYKVEYYHLLSVQVFLFLLVTDIHISVLSVIDHNSKNLSTRVVARSDIPPPTPGYLMPF